MLTVTNTVDKLLGEKFSRCESPSLRLEKYLDNDDKGKANEVQAIVNCTNAFAAPSTFRQYPGQVQLVGTLGGNLVVNHSGGILENTGLCLHRFFGYPIIPGSAIKGCTAHAAYREWKENPSPELATKIIAVFGFPLGDEAITQQIKEMLPNAPNDQAGKIAFLSATPLPPQDGYLVSDISTCHHPKYYQGKQLKAYDNEDPNPLPFPAVKAGVKFVFTIVPLRTANPDSVEQARQWLLQAMTLWGMGAKTAAGYGWFKFAEEDSKQSLAEGQKQEDERQQQLRLEQLAKQQQQAAEQQRQKEQEEEKLALEAKMAERQKRAAAMQNMSADERQDILLEEKCPDEQRFRSRLQEMARGNCPEMEEKAIIRALAGKYQQLWQNELKPLLNAKYRPQKGQPNWKDIASKIAERDRLYNGKENRQL